MNRAITAVTAVSLALATLALTPRDAHAQEPPAYEEVPREPAPTKIPQSTEMATRLGIVGTYHHVRDVPMYATGLSLSLAGSAPISGALSMRGALGRTEAGLSVVDIAVEGTFEALIADGIRFHAGGGVYALGIKRATTGNMVMGIGPNALIGLGYDSGASSAFFAVVDLEAGIYRDFGVVWGPTLTLGYRF